MGADQVVHLRRARDLMDARYADPLTLDDMAAVAGFSRYHFAREFRVVFGETPAAYLSRRRVERAKDLLTHANLTVTEVCMVVGFASLSSFSRRFGSWSGVRPVRTSAGPRRPPSPAASSWPGPGLGQQSRTSGPATAPPSVAA